MHKKKVLATMLLSTMLLSFTACSKSEKDANTNNTPSKEATSDNVASYKAGTYTGTGTGNNGSVTVEVTFSETEIVSVEVKDNKETTGICENAFDKIPAAIVSGQTLAVDTVSGAINSSNAVLTAVEDCVVQAGGNVEALKTSSAQKAEATVENLSCDVVVVGAGAAGSAAALSAAQSGARVILIKKTATPSGADAGGMYGNNYVVFEGGTLGFAYTSGRLAGANTANNTK